MPDTLTGVIERVTFHNLDTGFAVLRVHAGGHQGVVTVTGHLPNAIAGEYVEATGAWVQNRDHGLQFKTDTLRTTPPHTVEGIARYLGSGLVKGVGPHFAKKIVEVFGARTLAVIDESPAFLAEVKGIGPKRIQLIRQSWQEQKAVRSIMVFLQSYGVGTARAVRIYKEYGEHAIELVRANPYRLATDIWGIGFDTADKLALELGLDRQSPLRAQAALRYVLQEFSQQGHVGYPEAGVSQRTSELTQIPAEIITAAIEQARAAEEVVRDSPKAACGLACEASATPQAADEPWLFLKPLFLAEVGVARLIAQLQAGRHPMPKIDSAAALAW